MRIKDIIAIQEDVKAFPWAVQLTDAGGPLYSGGAPATYNNYNGGTASGRIQTPLSQRVAPLHMQTYGGSTSIDWLMDALGYVTDSAVSSDYHFQKGPQRLGLASNPDDPAKVPTGPADLIKLLASPNPYMLWEDLLTLLLIDWFIVGNAYWVKWQQGSTKKPTALYRMSPQYVRLIPGEFGPDAYMYRLPGQPNEIEFTPDQVCHFKRPNPNDPYYGLGVVQGGSRALDMEVALTTTAAKYYEQGALPSGVVETERRVPRDVFNKLKTQLRSMYSGGANAGQLMVLEAGLKYSAISPNASQALFVEMGGWSRDRVLALFRMNKSLLGVWDSGDNPNVAGWQQLFDQKTMIPLMARLGKMISRALTQPGWGLDIQFDYEKAAESVTPEQALKRASTMAAVPGVKVHELRTALGLEPSTGDKGVDETVLNMPGPEMDGNGAGGAADRNLPSEAGRPPLPQNTRAIGVGEVAGATRGGSRGGNRGVVAKPGRKSIEDILFDLETLEKQFDAKALAPANVTVGNQIGTPPEDTLASSRRMAVDELTGALRVSLAKAATQLERDLLDASEGKASTTVYQRIKTSTAWQKFNDRVRSLLEDSVAKGLSLANVQHAAAGLAPATMSYDDLVTAQLDRALGGVDSWVNTFQKQLLARILKIQRAGSDRTEVDRAIREQITAWQADKAQEIALTELTRAYNEGTAQVAEANDRKLLVSDGEDFDEPCAEANGQIWTAEQARERSIEHPNCRRAFVPVAG